jgi:hypothetical protein
MAGYAYVLAAIYCFLGPFVAGYLLHVGTIFCWPDACGC